MSSHADSKRADLRLPTLWLCVGEEGTWASRALPQVQIAVLEHEARQAPDGPAAEGQGEEVTAMSAQTFNGVTVGGTVENPTIINKGSKPVMGYAIWRDTRNGRSLKVVMDIDSLANGTPMGAGEERSALGLAGSFRSRSEGKEVLGYSLAAVLFSDGTFKGPENMLQIFSRNLSELRSLARDTQYRADKYLLMEDDRRALLKEAKVNNRTSLAHTLLVIRELKGEPEAEAALARLVGLPDVVKGEQQ